MLSSTIYVLFMLVLAAAAALVLGPALRGYARFRGRRVITCPENRQPAAVDVDARHAAATAAGRKLDLRLKDCSRWPERAGCGQACLAQIEEAPEDCLVRNLLVRWYAGKRCAFCQRPFGIIHWHDHTPALLNRAGKTVRWHEIEAEKVPAVLETHWPVCWNCHVAETFRREHPELVVDRDAEWSRHGERKGGRHQWVH